MTLTVTKDAALQTIITLAEELIERAESQKEVSLLENSKAFQESIHHITYGKISTAREFLTMAKTLQRK
jgi:hypothetical protein